MTEPLEQQKAIESHIKTQVGYELFKNKAAKLDEHLRNDEIDLYTYEEDIAQCDIHTLDTVIEAMVHHIMSESTTPVKIGTDFVGRAMLKSKLMKTDFTTMRHVVKTLYTNKNIKNKKHYAISMLYNA